MTLRKHFGWLDDDGRQKMLDDYIDRSGTAWFGGEPMDAAEKDKAVEDHFTRVAPTYDFMNTVMSFGIHHAWKRKAVRMLGLRPGDQVIDVCGGTGDLAVLCCRRVKNSGQIVIYDMNRAMMQAGRNRPENGAFQDRIDYAQGDAEAIAFADNRFDAAMVGFGIRNVTHLKRGVAEMYRVLKPGGRVLCLEFSKPVHPVFRQLYDLYSFYIMPFIGSLLVGNGRPYARLSETIRMFPTADELQQILETIGFEAVDYHRLTDGIAVIHIGRKSVS